jgi:hypothetical protein
MISHISSSSRYPVNITCIRCQQVFTIYVDTIDLGTWISGEGYIQDIMPYLTDSERELLISGYCGECFDQMFEIE